MPQQATDTLAEVRGSRQQADDHERLTGEVEEVSRVYEHAIPCQQADHQVLLGFERRNLDNRVPPGVRAKDTARRNCGRPRLEGRVVCADAIRNLLTDWRTRDEQVRGGCLNGRRDRQVRVADELETLERVSRQPFGTLDGDPAKLQLRKTH